MELKLNWPPEKTFNYKFNKNLELEIPLIKNKGENKKEDKGIEH